jgi:hypothetical protein
MKREGVEGEEDGGEGVIDRIFESDAVGFRFSGEMEVVDRGGGGEGETL